jgi:hypothetical protein
MAEQVCQLSRKVFGRSRAETEASLKRSYLEVEEEPSAG